MTTYNTYQEAKIANPECEIYQLERNGLFAHCDHHKAELVRFIEFDSAGIKCNPADYCMTVEKFLADGYRFVDGDLYIDWKGCVRGVGMIGHSVDACNDVRYIEDSLGSYILRAAALEEKKPRTKVEYVKSDIESRGRALDAFDGEVELFELVDGEYKQVTNESDAISKWRNLYERIETPMTEREAFVEALQELWIIDGVDGQEQINKIADSGKFKLVN